MAIRDDDDISSLYERIEIAGLELLQTHLPALREGRALFRHQEPGKWPIMPQRSPQDGLIDWTWPTRRIHDFIRAQTHPYPGAFTTYKEKKVSIWRSEPLVSSQSGDGPGGKILRFANDKQQPGLIIKTGSQKGGILAIRIGVGGEEMNALEYAKRYGVRIGDSFGGKSH